MNIFLSLTLSVAVLSCGTAMASNNYRDDDRFKSLGQRMNSSDGQARFRAIEERMKSREFQTQFPAFHDRLQGSMSADHHALRAPQVHYVDSTPAARAPASRYIAPAPAAKAVPATTYLESTEVPVQVRIPASDYNDLAKIRACEEEELRLFKRKYEYEELKHLCGVHKDKREKNYETCTKSLKRHLNNLASLNSSNPARAEIEERINFAKRTIKVIERLEIFEAIQEREASLARKAETARLLEEMRKDDEARLRQNAIQAEKDRIRGEVAKLEENQKQLVRNTVDRFITSGVHLQTGYLKKWIEDQEGQRVLREFVTLHNGIKNLLKQQSEIIDLDNGVPRIVQMLFQLIEQQIREIYQNECNRKAQYQAQQDRAYYDYHVSQADQILEKKKYNCN